MENMLILILFAFCISYSLQLSNESLNITNGGGIKRDVSFSYAATDIGSHEGTHVKTLTVIKNIVDPNKNKFDSVLRLYEHASEAKDNKAGQSKIEIPDIPQIPEEIFSEFNLFLKHEYVPKAADENKKEIKSDADKTTDEKNIKIEFNSNQEEAKNDGKIAEEDLLKVNAEEIKETKENVKSEKLKPSNERQFISLPILPEQAERSAKAQIERHQAKLIRSTEQKELFHPEDEQKSEKKYKFEPPFGNLFKPIDEKPSEPLLQLPFSFDPTYEPGSDKTVFPTKTTYNKKPFQTSVSPRGLNYKRDGIFIPIFSNSNYKPIKK